ncbi:hypothetical protein FHS43_006214 [Streptosporangium becharense]|uniref:Uncharacterized protein n=1 Tax=Streptosporangium becharense TaxID=1816182 RepID=A0A7W9MGM4_9ACTN|nr:hypothetical protein [Streptosporangium becharense]MBB2914902.1 hypothetical protein [Streptosporangium becharense]MBB5820287.1 hypothetical protein [Streptosporangium becharense]
MPPRIIVAIELVSGGRARAVCRTEGCTALEGRRWKGEPRVTKTRAAKDAGDHRRWHRHQQPIPEQAVEAGA